METIEVMISDIIIQHPEINSFQELLEAVRGISSNEMLFLNFDVKPDFRDTHRVTGSGNWKELSPEDCGEQRGR